MTLSHPLLGRVAVRAPYVSFLSLDSHAPGEVVAHLRPEQPLGQERGPIAISEAGRHMAILGALAAASLQRDDARRHYLAKAAVVERSEVTDDAGEPLQAVAHALLEGRRAAAARIELRNSRGQWLYRLRVTYALLAEPVFSRLFSANCYPESETAGATSGYTESLKLERISGDAETYRARIPRVTAQMCQGHFHDYPALPVARLMSALIGCAGEVLAAQFDVDALPFYVDHGNMVAENLAFTGQSVDLLATYRGRRDTSYEIDCVATGSEGQQFGRIALKMRAADVAAQTWLQRVGE